MTVGTTGNRFTYAGDGSTLEFAFPRPFDSNGDLRVILRDGVTGAETVQTIETDYGVAGAGQPSGGTVTMTSAPQAGETLVIVRRTMRSGEDHCERQQAGETGSIGEKMHRLGRGHKSGRNVAAIGTTRRLARNIGVDGRDTDFLLACLCFWR